MNKKWYLVFGFLIAIWLVKAPAEQWIFGDEVVSIKLKVGQDGWVVVDIPSKFIGPSHLSLVSNVKNSTEPVGMIPLAFTYPSFEPWSTGLFDKLGEGEEKVFLVLTGGRGEKHGYNDFVYSQLGLYKDGDCKAKKYSEKRHNMHRYKIFTACAPHLKKYHFQDLYFYDAPGDSERDIMVKCSALSKTQKCSMHIKYDDMGLVRTSFMSISHELLADWQNVIVDYQKFIASFYEKNITTMKKPTPLTEKRKREISHTYPKEWKP